MEFDGPQPTMSTKGKNNPSARIGDGLEPIMNSTTTLPDKSDTSRLYFDSREDVLDNINKVTENFKNRLAANHRYFVKGYVHGKLRVILNCVASGTNEEFDLLLDAIPDGINRYADDGPSSTYITEHRSNCDVEELVFVRDIHRIECPEKIVPSSVRLVRAKERTNFFGNVFGSSLEGMVEFGLAPGERKGGVGGIGLARGDCRSVSGIVKRGSEVVDSISSEIREGIWHGSVKPELVKLMLRFIRINLYERTAWAFREEGSPFPFEIRNMFLCTRDLAA